jgi:hypothetical protein
MNTENAVPETPKEESQTKAEKMKGNKRGVKFTAGNQPENRGRKPSRMKGLIQAFQMDDETRAISKEDSYRLLTHLLSCSKSQLEAMARNPDLPIAILTQIKAIITDLAGGSTSTVDRLFDRLYGRSMQPMEITGTKGIPLIPDKPMSRKSYELLLNRLQCGAL